MSSSTNRYGSSSPYRTHTQEDFDNHQENQDLTKYLNDSFGHENYSDKLKKQIVFAEIQCINSELSNICKQKFGNLTISVNNSAEQWVEIEKTIKLVKSLLSIIYRDSEYKKQLHLKQRKSQQQLSKLTSSFQKLSQTRTLLSKQKQNLENKIKSLERQFRQDLEKLKRQKDEYEKKFNQILSRENQYKNEFRKNQQTICQLQQKLKAKTVDKGNVKNTFEKIQEVKHYGPPSLLSNSENQYSNFFLNNFQQTYRIIVEENEYLKKCLCSIYEQLHTILQVKKQGIKKRKGFSSALESQAFELENVRPESFFLPKGFSAESVSRLNQNLLKFKQAARITDIVTEKVQEQKGQCVNNVKSLISNYKDIIQGQDRLINRVVLRSKEYRTNSMQAIQDKYSRSLQQDELQRSRRFLQQQRQMLLIRNKQLESTKKAMKSTIKKAEEQRRAFCKRKEEMNGQLQTLKKNIEKIPGILEQQLGNIV